MKSLLKNNSITAEIRVDVCGSSVVDFLDWHSQDEEVVWKKSLLCHKHSLSTSGWETFQYPTIALTVCILNSLLKDLDDLDIINFFTSSSKSFSDSLTEDRVSVDKILDDALDLKVHSASHFGDFLAKS